MTAHGLSSSVASHEPSTWWWGADGLHSKVRALASGEESQFIRQLGRYISMFTTDNHLNLDRWELFYNAPGRLANVYSARRNTEAKALFVFASEPLDYDRHDIGQQQKILAQAFAGVGWEVPRLLDAMWYTPDFYFDSISQVHMYRWSKGRVALVGDAGYSPSPASGQGTSLALVGAYVLAGELAAAAGDHRTACARYEEEIRPYVEANLNQGQKIAIEMVPRSRQQIWLRTQMMQALPYLPWKDLVTRRLLQPLQQAANAIALKDYQG